MNKEENDTNKASENDDMNSPGGAEKGSDVEKTDDRDELKLEGPHPADDLKDSDSPDQTLQGAYSDLQNEYDILKKDSEILQNNLGIAEDKILELEKDLSKKAHHIKSLQGKLKKAGIKEENDDKIRRH